MTVRTEPTALTTKAAISALVCQVTQEMVSTALVSVSLYTFEKQQLVFVLTKVYQISTIYLKTFSNNFQSLNF